MRSRAGRLAFAIGLALARRAWAGDAFEAVLAGSNEVPGPGMEEGTFVAAVLVEGTKVTLTLTPKNVRGWMSAHIHRGGAGVSGRLVAEFPWSSGDGSPRMSVGSVSARAAAGLVANPGKYYVDVHTPGFPAGAARGQLAASANPDASSSRAPMPAGTVAFDPNAVRAVGSLPPFRSPSKPTYAAFFSRLEDLDEAADDDEDAGLADQAAEKRRREARAAGLTEREATILKEVAYECNRALVTLEARLHEGPKLFDERNRVAEKYVAQLRARLGDAAFANLDSYVGDHFFGGPDAPQAPPPSSRFEPAPDAEQRILIGKAEQRIDGAAPATKTYLDPDFPLAMSATSGLAIVFFAWGDCTVYGSTVHITGAGSCSFTAHQPGDSNTLAARIVDQSFPIAKAEQTIEFVEFPGPHYGPSDLPLYARASSGLPVTYGAWGPCSTFGSALLVFDSGECWVTADQPGDRNFNPAPSVKRNVQIIFPPPPPPPD